MTNGIAAFVTSLAFDGAGGRVVVAGVRVVTPRAGAGR
jgi:hypothetical protein